MAAFAVVWPAVHPSAQTLGDVLRPLAPNRAQMAQAQRQADQAQLEERCRGLIDWAGSGDAGAAPAALPNRYRPGQPAAGAELNPTLRLFADPVFKPVFGKAFDEFTPSERLLIYTNTFEACARGSRTYGNAVRSLITTVGAPFQDVGAGAAVYRPAGAMTAAAVSDAVKKMRGAGGNVDNVLSELNGLPSTAASWEVFQARKAQADEAIRFLPAADRPAAQESVRAVGRRLAPVAMKAIVDDAVAAATGADSLRTLRAAADRLRGFEAYAPPADLSVARQALDQRREALVHAAVAPERQRFDTIPADASGLQMSVVWYQDLQRRFDADLQREAEYRSLMQDFRNKRNAQLVSGQAQLGGQLQAARNSSQLSEALARALPIPGDADTEVGRALRAIAQEREEVLHKAEVLGSQANETASSASSDSLLTPAPAKPSNATAGSTLPRGEPTASEMYDLLQAKFDSAAAEYRQMAQACNGGSRNDVGAAIMCMAGSFGQAAGATEPMKITKFEKLGCERASGEPGYVCDYLLTTSGGAQNAMGPSMAALLGRGGAGQARFLKTKDGWLAYFNETK